MEWGGEERREGGREGGRGARKKKERVLGKRDEADYGCIDSVATFPSALKSTPEVCMGGFMRSELGTEGEIGREGGREGERERGREGGREGGRGGMLGKREGGMGMEADRPAYDV